MEIIGVFGVCFAGAFLLVIEIWNLVQADQLLCYAKTYFWRKCEQKDQTSV